MPISLKSFAHHKAGMIAAILLLTGFLFLLSMLTGAATVSLNDTLQWLRGTAEPGIIAILQYIRLPRTLGCLLVGGALATAGLLLQTALNNPLASPGIIGVNAGSAFFVVLASILFIPFFWVRGMAAFLGALLTAMGVYLLAKKTGASRITIILAGVAISSLLTAGMDTITTLYPNAIMDKAAFYIGGFANIHSQTLLFTFPFLLAGLLGAWLLSGRLDLLLLGDEVAASLGLNVDRCRFLTILFASVLAASAISIAGMIGFVGLIVPHIVRQLIGHELRFAIPVTALFGSCLTLLSDIIARLLFAPYEIPAGIILSAIGAPFFLHLILTRRKHRYDPA